MAKLEMNELAKQAGLEYNFDPMLWLKYEKFAELIIRECVSICKDKERPNLYGVREVETAIKQHFGVKHEY